MNNFPIIVIGASMGGVEALQQLAAGLRPDIAAALLVVQHIGRCPSQLPELIEHSGPLRAIHAAQGEPINPGCIYVAPPDHHLIVQGRRMRLTRGPRENWARPAIDPLFRSAAKEYRRNAIGVILTGMLNDGSAGLRAIRAAGGLAVVQEPTEAFASEMPWSALRHAGADYRVSLAQIPRLLAQLANELVLETQENPSERRWRANP